MSVEIREVPEHDHEEFREKRLPGKKGGADHGPDGAGADLPDPEGRF